MLKWKRGRARKRRMLIEITIDGKPVAKGRPRFARRGAFVSTYTPAKTADYEAIIAAAGRASMIGQKLTESALVAFFDIFIPYPKAFTKKQRSEAGNGILRPVKKPDWDNFGKIISDALNGIVYKDDSQIVEGTVRKFYSDHPCVKITIKTVDCNSP